ncbi:uncharacterized protein BO80DRAFT_237872 [Aspergillus ibericus CBS 121593]|uniref:Uncharacterized protein n=1 Tax=Aspergillus ibericus CBS 121593 TaxID=1448316 RepID=A0A395H9G1_9EURO|nr:hypothetical protein BO80DRAFT_237872 [Aspergillus ibericus CBS 121593]RAL04492.1 hypothetical protein BO80DRAFT_237872 [Aspergillus ibericus CBS 121593]
MPGGRRLEWVLITGQRAMINFLHPCHLGISARGAKTASMTKEKRKIKKKGASAQDGILIKGGNEHLESMSTLVALTCPAITQGPQAARPLCSYTFGGLSRPGVSVSSDQSPSPSLTSAGSTLLLTHHETLARITIELDTNNEFVGMEVRQRAETLPPPIE